MALKLYKFQRVGVDFLARTRRCLLADDMGLGKTIQAIAACKDAGRVLVVCPNTLKGNWKIEINKWAPGQPVSVLRGTPKAKSKVLQNFGHGYLVVNIETARPPRVSALLGTRWDVLIVDEAHSVKNRKSKQTKGIKRLAAQTTRVYLLTGTPIMNRVDELWSPLNVLYPHHFTSFWKFVKQHARAYKGRWGWVIDGKPTFPDKLRAEITPVFLRREKEEVYPDMPRKIYQEIWLDLTGEQLRIYQEIEQTATAQIDNNTVVVTPGILSQLTRCKQVAVSPGLIGGKPEGVKLDALLDIINGTNQKALVFSQFAEAIKLVAARLTENGIAHVTLIGETKEEERDDVIKKFQSVPEIRVFLATTQAGGSGITLTAASLVIFLDKQWTPAANEQAVDRTRPHLQKQPVQIISLLGRDTVDEVIEEVLSGKVSIIEAIINKKRRAENEQ